ncbi:MAG TPA: hypothetical protein VM284_04515 [Candidatus Limnocylindria bacterium]|nr:hypothetical protein [Candidatus Limnocylindria bacterium]
MDLFQAPEIDAVEGLSGATQAVAGEGWGCALASGGLWCWGYGYLGDGAYHGDFSGPVQVIGGAGATSISAGDDMTCMTKDDGTAWCWGEIGRGKLGDLNLDDLPYEPLQVPGIGNAAKVVAGSSGGCALLTDGTVSCWGDERKVACGVDTCAPAVKDGITGAIDVVIGRYGPCALLESGEVSCWGHNSNPAISTGQAVLGAEELTNAATLVSTALLASMACASDASASVICWVVEQTGSDFSSEIKSQGPQASLAGASSVALTSRNTCAVLDGSIQCSEWEDDAYHSGEALPNIFPSPESVYQP